MRRFAPRIVLSVIVLASAGPARADGWTLETVETSACQIYSTSLALDPAGGPHIG